jgi:SSS family solute:Na+ symporter
MVNVAVGIVWQTCLIALPIYIVIKENTSLFVTIAILVISSMILKKNWYDKLEEE